MTDWIADAEAGSSVRAKLNDVWVPIASAAISSPVASIGISLPTTYSAFKLILTNLIFASSEALFAVVSQDGGSTFFYDTDHFDTYGLGRLYWSGAAARFDAFDAWDQVGQVATAVGPFNGEMTIYPGAANKTPYLLTDFAQQVSNYKSTPDQGISFGKSLVYLNPNPTVGAAAGAHDSPNTAAINFIRLQGYDMSVNISGGAYQLFGVPKP